MKFLEKLVWILSGVIIAALLLLLIKWQPSPVPTDAIAIKEVGSKPASRRSGSPRSAPGGGRGSSGRSSTSDSSGPSTARPEGGSASANLPYTPRAKNYSQKDFEVGPEFREKYGDNYREVWEALQPAEAELITRADGSKVVKIVSIPNDSIIQKLGFRIGDEISVVNDLDFSDFEGSVGDMYSRGQEMYDQLREETQFQVELERDGVPMILHYHIPK